jgi:hypothetical protein
MPVSDVLTNHEILRLAPMLFGRIRWHRSFGGPVGDVCSGFAITAEEHTASQFRIGPSGPEVIPGTGIWTEPRSVPCYPAPDEGDLRVVRFSVPDVHLNAFPDGKYRVRARLTGNWAEPPIQMVLGFRRIEPTGFYVSLSKDNHVVSVDFDVIHEPWRHLVG